MIVSSERIVRSLEAQIMEYEGQQIVVVIWHKEELSATAAAVESKNIYPAGKWLG